MGTVAARAARRERGIDRITIGTRDTRSARALYELALGPLGFGVSFDWPEGGRAYLGIPGEPSCLWLVEADDPGRTTVALAAATPTAVDAFHSAAVGAGATSIEPPAHRPELSERAYSACVADRDGNLLEAMCWNAPPLPALRATDRAA